VKARELKRALRKAGWTFIRQEGSHETWEHPEYGRQQIAVHNDGIEFGKAIMGKIKKQFKL
jgi:predicted RNA binding protein YcfA (HicA-like mRNA interferase family)